MNYHENIAVGIRALQFGFEARLKVSDTTVVIIDPVIKDTELSIGNTVLCVVRKPTKNKTTLAIVKDVRDIYYLVENLEQEICHWISRNDILGKVVNEEIVSNH